MEEVEFDFFDFPEIPPTRFVAVFDKDTGKITNVGPDVAYLDKEYVIEIEKELAEDILSGSIRIHDCFLDFYENKVEVKQSSNLYKIDDVLHRITESKFSDVVDPDIYVSYNTSTTNLSIELSERFYGTKKMSTLDYRKQKMIWGGETELTFYITAYNDPHVIYDVLTISVADIIEKSYNVNVILPSKFSIFTRRLFKKYTMEII